LFIKKLNPTGYEEIMKLKKETVVKRVLPVLAGGLLGYANYHFIGCSSGSCPIRSNPYLSIAYGAMAGGIFSFPDPKRTKENNQSEKK
jgi:hypothetical protein